MQNPLNKKFLPVTSLSSGFGEQVTSDIYCYTIQIVNICLVGTADHFVLIDAGMPGSAKEIISRVTKHFGREAKPKAIILTHGHFDHVGALIDLVEFWNVPVYAHKLELPYLRGEQNYPEPNPKAKGLVAKMSPLFPREPIILGNYVKPLPENHTIPHMPDWHWVPTPGHSPGHVSLFRETDHALIVGDAFVTVKQESLYRVFMQEVEVNGPPKYFTLDWVSAKESVTTLYELEPKIAIAGHGMPLKGTALHQGLKSLVDHFDEIAIPDNLNQKGDKS